MTEKALRVDATAIMDRMMQRLNIKNVAELAKFLDVSAQAVSNAKQRSTIPLTYLLKHSLETGDSLDWLVFGIENNSVEIKSLDNTQTSPLRFDAQWLNSKIGNVDHIRYLAINNSTPSCERGDVLLINTDDVQIQDGLFVFDLNGQPVTKAVKIQLDGSITIDKQPIDAAVVTKLQPLGRVIWKGSFSVTQ